MGVAADIQCYASLNMPTTDSGTSGGAIDPDTRVVFTQLAADDDIEAVSSSAADTTQQVTVTARLADGTVDSETKTLTGTTAVIFSTLGVVDRVLSVVMDADAAGTVTVRRSVAGATLSTIPVGERGFRCVHQQFAALSTGAEEVFMKVFLKNAHGSDSFNDGSVLVTDDPSGHLAVACAATVDDSGSVSNRLTSPGLTFGASSALPSALAAGSAIGVWLRFTHPQGDPDLDTTSTIALEGTFP